MDLESCFDPIGLEHFDGHYRSNPQSMASLARVHTPEAFPAWDWADIVLFGVPDDRGSTGRKGAAQAADRIRAYFYQLASPLTTLKLADLGNFVVPDDRQECFETLAEVTETLLKAGKTLVVLGGTQDLTYPLYIAHQGLEQDVNYVCIDSSPDILDPSQGLHHHSFNNSILTHAPNFLNSFSVLATQSYFVTEGERKALKALNFENLRVGEIHANIALAEPFLREAHLVSYDVSAIRHADAPGTNHPSPGGLSVEEACQLARFAGMGYHSQCLHLAEVNPELDIRNMTSHLTALLAWYFMEGFYNRRDDRPKADRSNLVKYIAPLQAGPVQEIVFFKSPSTQRWWMEVPSPGTLQRKEDRRLLVPCAQQDYRLALDNEVPERWWTVHYRF